MNSEPYTVPILLIIFNRSDKVVKLIDALSKIKPTKLYIAADGPRDNVPSDAEKCQSARKAALNISWPCKVETLFSDKNLGVDPAVEKAINWFFSQNSEGIILEDDCIPNPDFFYFAEKMLAHYRQNDKIMMISGNNFQDGQKRGEASYYLSRYATTWGWATWKRAWEKYDSKMTDLNDFAAKIKQSNIRPHRELKYWMNYFKKLQSGKHTAWDGKWLFTIWNKDGLCVVPNVNLVRNVGFDNDSTHTTSESASKSIPTESLNKEIIYTKSDTADKTADSYIFKNTYKTTLYKKIKYKLKNAIKSWTK